MQHASMCVCLNEPISLRAERKNKRKALTIEDDYRERQEARACKGCRCEGHMCARESSAEARRSNSIQMKSQSSMRSKKRCCQLLLAGL